MFSCGLTCFLLNFRLKLSIVYIYDTPNSLVNYLFVSSAHFSVVLFVLFLICITCHSSNIMLCYVLSVFPSLFELLFLKHHSVYPRFQKEFITETFCSLLLCVSVVKTPVEHKEKIDEQLYLNKMEFLAQLFRFLVSG